ncbi:Axonemal dynein light chain domain-containing protein 1 [Channa argus]|uniref:Axonemal dynein light chain domain-containing protein 1 n=1 Tax=Channa argus TaxID=215402 RepID=A0A6G1PKG7_CHAAH|nr:Axonemal dynein light chain domain-containing protein 1 [Channa argus]
MQGCGIRRPDAVWHHPLGRKKYQYFLEQPTSLTGAGRDISFLCDAMVTQKKTAPLPPLTERSSSSEGLSISENVITEEYQIVKNKGLRSLEFYEDAFTVQLHDDEQTLRVFPSLRPSGRLEVVQLMRMMDDMLEKAGVDQQSEELTELSQMEGLLELVQVEQNIYNIVFHELIRQVSVGCAERGQLLAKLRQRYQSLLERIPRRLKTLHTEAVAQRALDRRLIEEIHHIKTSIQQLSVELSKIRDHDTFVSQQAEHAHRQLAEALNQTLTNADVLQGYHELYELQRNRLEAQLLQMIEERDYWSQHTLCLALKVIRVKKLKMVSQLHVCEQNWFKTAEHCILFLTSKDTEDLNIIMELYDHWKEQLTAFMFHLQNTEHAQCEQISAIKHGISKWLTFCITQKCPDPKFEKSSLETLHVDLKQWSNMLALICERYQGEELLNCQQTLGELGSFQDKWQNMSLEVLGRHCSPDGEPPASQRDLIDLNTVLSELFKKLDTQVSGESGIHTWIMSLHGLMESWVTKLDAMITCPDNMSMPDLLNLEKALQNWLSLAEDAPNISRTQTENEKDKSKPDIYKETKSLLDKVQEFITNLSEFTDGENQTLSEEVSSLHMAQTSWMLDLLIFMVPDNSEDQNQEQEQYCITDISLQTLEEDARILAEKLDYFSKHIISHYEFILGEQTLQSLSQTDAENEMTEYHKLQTECTDWVETCKILLSDAKSGPVGPATRSDVPLTPADSMDTLVNKDLSAELTTDSEAKTVKCEIEGEKTEVEQATREEAVMKLIGYDGNITQRILGDSSVRLSGTDQLVVSPATHEALKAFSDLTTVGVLQQELHDAELRVQSAEHRALKAEEDLQAALEKIQDLERQLQGRPSLEPSSEETRKTPPPSLPLVKTAQPAPPKKTLPETKPKSNIKRTKKH